MKLYRFLFVGISLFSCQSKEHVKVITKEVIVKEKCNPIENDSTNPLFDCYDGSQLDMNICSSKELAYYDSILNLKYKQTLQQLDIQIKEEKETYSLQLKNTLIDSQKKWINMKESNREVIENYYNGGSIRSLAKNTQTINDTKERIKFLEQIASE